MGCVCAKGILSEERFEIKREKSRTTLSRRFVASSRRDEVVVLDADAVVVNDVSASLIPKLQENSVLSSSLSSGERRKKKRDPVHGVVVPPPPTNASEPQRHPTIGTGTAEVNPKLRIVQFPNAFEAECVSAGWPSWLVSVAGEAIKGWVPRKADSFQRLDKIGQGTYSNVYKANDLETGKTVALKKVRFVNMDPESVRFMAREIYVLRRLDHINIVKLEGLITSRSSSSLYLVFEYMEHDLAGLAASPSIKFSESQVKCYIQQLLHGLDHCHKRGVLHRDIKGANLLIDNNGILKIADFGLATFFRPDKKQQLTSRVVTLWYRPPELLLGATDYSIAVDLWSTGCILAELLAGKPIMPGRTEVEQLHKIFKLCGSPSEEYWLASKLPHATIFKPQHPYHRCVNDAFKDFPPSTLALLDVLLAIEPANRGTAASALASDFFNTKPYACDPSFLPKYLPTKELDLKLREEEARRQRAAALKGHGSESMRRGPGDPKAIPDTTEKRVAQPNRKSSSVRYNPPEEDAPVFSIDPHNGAAPSCKNMRVEEQRHIPVRSLSAVRISNDPELKTQRSYVHRGVGDGLNLSGFLGAAAKGERSSQHLEQEGMHYLLQRPTSSHKKEERIGAKESTAAYSTKKNRIHYSGLLVPSGGNLEEVLMEHERQIEQVVRRARVTRVGNGTRNHG